jgi:hypothetical protein
LRAGVDYDEQAPVWPLKRNADDFVNDQMGDFTKPGSSAGQRLIILRAAGINFYEAAPENFKTVLWELIKRDVLKTIYIVTDEPAFPWELMIPSPPDDPNAQREPLGVEFTVGRWITKRALSPPQQVSITTALVIAAPLDDTEADTLAADEVTQIVGIFPGEQVTPATADNLEQMLTNHPADLLHFVCHGKSGVGHGRQKLGLANSTELDSTLVPAMAGFNSFFHQRNRPVVFLNACEVGNLESALVGVGGFPKVFASLKAAAVIAPLWSVKHKAAHDVAREFYDRLKNEPTTSMATMIRDIRRKTYRKGAEQGEESYAAYCFYGDPLCARERVLVDNRMLVNSDRVPEQALESTSTTTTAETIGTITEFTPGTGLSEFTPGGSIVLKQPSGLRDYRLAKNVIYLSRSGKVLDRETVTARAKAGVRIHVHYVSMDDNRVVDRVILDED